MSTADPCVLWNPCSPVTLGDPFSVRGPRKWNGRLAAKRSSASKSGPIERHFITSSTAARRSPDRVRPASVGIWVVRRMVEASQSGRKVKSARPMAGISASGGPFLARDAEQTARPAPGNSPTRHTPFATGGGRNPGPPTCLPRTAAGFPMPARRRTRRGRRAASARAGSPAVSVPSGRRCPG